MKKRIAILLFLVFTASLFTACQKNVSNTKELEAYKASMEVFFSNLTSIDAKIKEIDPESQNSCNDLLDSLNKLEDEFKKLSEMTVPSDNVPETFAYIPELSKQAYDYMCQTNEYMKDAFQDGSYNENVYDAGIECYKRANKRVHYIISLLHGEYPQDDAISYQ